MRVTNNLMISRFSRSMNAASQNLSDVTEQVSTGMKYSKGSQDTASALKSFKIRRSLSRVEQYQDNIGELQSALEETETTLSGIKDVLVQATESLTQGLTGTLSQSDRDTVASVFKSLQEQLLKLANTNFAGKYILGGPNTTEVPFTLESGKIFYNGEDMDNDDISTEQIYGDMGMGIAFDAYGNLLSGKGVRIATPGSQVLGYGIDSDGLPNNVYNLFTDIVDMLESGDTTNGEQYMQKLNEMTDNILVQIADVGERGKFVEFLNDRMSSDKLNLTTKQTKNEGVNEAEAITEYYSASLAYQSALQMGSKIIKSTIFDYLR